MEPRAAAAVLMERLKKPTQPMTVADASAESGLPLRDAESGLHFLTSEYRGHLRVTDDGDLVHVFPNGFSKPWETRDAMDRFFGKVGHGLMGAGRFVLRAWILIVMVGYTAVFVALLIALMFARQGGGGDRDRGSGIGFASGLIRGLAEAFFWTFHPFSPFYYDAGNHPLSETERGRRRMAAAEPKTPFYQRVSRFVFGPEVIPEDPHAMRARVLAEIRARKGRIGLSDVMRVTGLPRDVADPLMARLMLDHDGTVEVAEQGGIVYRFSELRRTAEEGPIAFVAPAWQTPKTLPPLTGNDAGSNLKVAALNGFNLLMGAFVIARGFTIANLITLFSKHPRGVVPVLTDHSMPIALGLIPLAFSILFFIVPLMRAAFRGRAQKKVAEENARLAILREVLTRAPKKEPVKDETLRTVYRVATGHEPTSKELTRRVVDLGGDVDVGPQGEVRYRFPDLELEAEAIEEERAHADVAEAKLGRVVFTSE
jgi:hypothetical protein